MEVDSKEKSLKVTYFIEGLINNEVETAIITAIRKLGFYCDGSGACMDKKHGRDLYFYSNSLGIKSSVAIKNASQGKGE